MGTMQECWIVIGTIVGAGLVITGCMAITWTGLTKDNDKGKYPTSAKKWTRHINKGAIK